MKKKEFIKAVETMLGDKDLFYEVIRTDSQVTVPIFFKHLSIDYDNSFNDYDDLWKFISGIEFEGIVVASIEFEGIVVASIELDDYTNCLVFYKSGKEQEVYKEIEVLLEKRKQASLKLAKMTLDI